MDVTSPPAAADAATAPAPAVAATVPAPEAHLKPRPRVVIADDDADIRTLISIAARRAHLDIAAEVDNGRDALAAIRAGGIDLAVLDISMPGVTGIDVLRSVRSDAQFTDTHVLVISASVQMLQAEGEVAELADGYVIKPFSPRELADRLNEIFEGER